MIEPSLSSYALTLPRPSPPNNATKGINDGKENSYVGSNLPSAKVATPPAHVTRRVRFPETRYTGTRRVCRCRVRELFPRQERIFQHCPLRDVRIIRQAPPSVGIFNQSLEILESYTGEKNASMQLVSGVSTRRIISKQCAKVLIT